MEIFFAIHGIIVIAGGIIAYRKNDYFTRGFFICFITSVFGLIALLKAKPSLAKTGDEHDKHYWPGNSHYALLATFFLLICVWLFN